MSRYHGGSVTTEAAQRFEALFESMVDACFVIDQNWVFTLANTAASRLTKISKKKLIGLAVTDAISGNDRDTLLHPYRQVMEDGQPRRFTTTRLPLPQPTAGHYDITVCSVPEGIMCIAHNVSDRVRTEEALKNSEAHYHALFEESHEAIFIASPEGDLVDFNQKMLDLLAYTRQDATTLHTDDFFVEAADRDEFMSRIMNEKAIRDFQVRLKRKDGTIIDCQVTATLWHDPGGEINGVQGIIRDVTVQKQVIDALRDSEERFRAIFEGTTLGITLIDLDGNLIVTNRAYQAMMGFTNEAMRSMTFADITHPDDRQKSLEEFNAMVHGSSNGFQLEKRYIRVDGSVLWANLTASIVRDRDGRPQYVVSAIEDITKRIQAEEGEQRLNHALRATAMAINSTLNLDEVLRLILEGVRQVVPHDAATIMLIEDELLKITGHYGYAENRLEQLLNAMKMRVEDVPTFRIMAASRQPLMIARTADSEDWVQVDKEVSIESYVAAPICLDDEVIGFINLDSFTPGFFTDTDAERLMTFADQAATAIKNARLFANLEQHATELQARNEDLDAFSVMVGHELNGPLHVVLGYTSFILSDYREQISDEVFTHLKQVESYAYKMQGVIESLRLLATLRNANTIIKAIEVEPVVQAAIDRLKPRAKEDNVTITVDLPIPSAMAYGPWLEEVIANLIENAIKYKNKSISSPTIAIRGYLTDDRLVRFEVSDNGVGIEPEFLKDLFKAGFRAKPGRVKGTGLGLALVERIVLRMNGKVGVESERGKGSTFWFSLPSAAD